MEKYSLMALAKHALTGHKNWPKIWRSPKPKAAYDVVIIGGGGHGLATAYYLAKKYGISNIAVLEKGWLGGGNTGRNTATVRSNYFYPESTRFFDHSLKLFEGLSAELNYNMMLSQGGVLNLAHSRHELEMFERWSNAIRLQGVDAEMLTPQQIQARTPALDISSSARYPIWGGFIQHRGGVARHDAVAWGYARAADHLGVDILQNCEVTGITTRAGQSAGRCIHSVETSQGTIRADKVALTVAGHTSVLGAMVGLDLPIHCQPLQAMVSEPIKPVLDGVVISPVVHAYVHQSDRGEIVLGGGTDRYPSYGQRGNLPLIEQNVAALLALFPSFSRLKLMRQWAGIVDITPDTSPIMGKTPITGLYLSGGWGTGGFKAIPAGGDTLAYTIAHDRPHELIEPFGLERFVTGALIDEGAASGVSH
ncbi:sarcosine oxidase subunit beta family protein [Porticoccaceae bacterium]|nr:sarcosine oxidase subunit beta family protein [Porticoccaceae bacterium]